MAQNLFKMLLDGVLKHTSRNGVVSGHSTTAGRKLAPPKKMIKEDVPTDADIEDMQSPLRKIQYGISKAKGTQVR